MHIYTILYYTILYSAILHYTIPSLIGFVWPARNGTESDPAAAGSDGTGSVLEPVPKLLT